MPVTQIKFWDKRGLDVLENYYFSYVVEHSEGNEQHLLEDDVTWARLQKKGGSSFRNAEEIHL